MGSLITYLESLIYIIDVNIVMDFQNSDIRDTILRKSKLYHSPTQINSEYTNSLIIQLTVMWDALMYPNRFSLLGERRTRFSS